MCRPEKIQGFLRTLRASLVTLSLNTAHTSTSRICAVTVIIIVDMVVSTKTFNIVNVLIVNKSTTYRPHSTLGLDQYNSPP